PPEPGPEPAAAQPPEPERQAPRRSATRCSDPGTSRRSRSCSAGSCRPSRSGSHLPRARRSCRSPTWTDPGPVRPPAPSRCPPDSCDGCPSRRPARTGGTTTSWRSTSARPRPRCCWPSCRRLVDLALGTVEEHVQREIRSEELAHAEAIVELAAVGVAVRVVVVAADGRRDVPAVIEAVRPRRCGGAVAAARGRRRVVLRMNGTHAAQGQGNHEIKALVLHQVSPRQFGLRVRYTPNGHCCGVAFNVFNGL